MIFPLTYEEHHLLAQKGISFDPAHNYSTDEALALLDAVRAAENSYAQFYNCDEETLFFRYGDLADRLFALIGED
ncbi:MAG: hypothetical protein J6J83_00180 [Oscillospiraceae bacterium]|nr:hypothetical protein [Oscillospiraceae bacterium]